jgi:chitin synthase
MKDVIRWEMTNNFIIPIIYLKALILFVVVGYALPILWTLSPSKWVDMVMDLPSYIFYVPSYINVLLIYSFCRIDDLSWGTKGLEDDIERQRSN